MNGDLTCLGCEHSSFNAHDITDIHLLKIFIRFLAYAVPGNIDLDGSLQVLYIAERSFAHHTLEHHTSCDDCFLSFPLLVIIFHIHTVDSHIIFCNLERILSSCLKFGQFLPARFQHMIQILFRLVNLLLLSHVSHSFVFVYS
ncbi:Uncharacterised protein [uncultured Clostridium sp.]|nr:Uncharacterised protein [uncultured Clostridium sp.]